MTEKTNPLRDDFLAGESQQGADDASALPSRLDRYSIAHRRALHMANYAIGQQSMKVAQKLTSCGSWLLFHDYYTVGKVRLAAANSCDISTLCPLCAIRRGAKLLKAYMDRVQVVQGEDPHLAAYLVTVTVRDGADLAERFKNLRGAMRRMTQARRDHLSNPKKNRHVEFAKAVGGVHSIETKRGKNSGLWHPHAHMVWFCHEAPDPSKLASEWKQWTGDSFIVDVRPFRNGDELLSGFLEVFKYALKFSDMSLNDNWHAFQTLKGKRLVDSFGCLRGVEVPEELTDEGLDDLPYVEMLYRFTAGGYSLSRLGDLDVLTGEVHPRLLSHIETPSRCG